MIEASCHCGDVRIEVPSAPAWVTECCCSICRRIGGLWAYYSPREVRVITTSGSTASYIWGDKMIERHWCTVCGCTTHWLAIDSTYDRMGVNARLMDPDVVAAAKYEKITGPDDPDRPSLRSTTA